MTAMTPAIAARIIVAMGEGLNAKEAIDRVLGEGTSAKLVDDLYHELRAKAE